MFLYILSACFHHCSIRPIWLYLHLKTKQSSGSDGQRETRLWIVLFLVFAWRRRRCRGAEKTTWRGRRSPPTSRERSARSRRRSRSTAAATPSCARRTALWPRSWRDSSPSTTSGRRWGASIRTQHSPLLGLIHITSCECFPEPGESLQAQRPEGEAPGNQTFTGQLVPERSWREAQAGEADGTVLTGPTTAADTKASFSRFISQLLKQAEEYKLQLKALKAQESEMRNQVDEQVWVGFSRHGDVSDGSPPSTARHVLQEVWWVPGNGVEEYQRLQRLQTRHGQSKSERLCGGLIVTVGDNTSRRFIFITPHLLLFRWQRKWRRWRKNASRGKLALMVATKAWLTWWQM